MDCRLASLSVPRFRLLPAAIVVLPPSPVFATWAAVRFTSRPAAAVSEPPAPETYKPATRLMLVRLPWEFWLSRVVDTTLRSRSAVAVRLLAASILQATGRDDLYLTLRTLPPRAAEHVIHAILRQIAASRTDPR